MTNSKNKIFTLRYLGYFCKNSCEYLKNNKISRIPSKNEFLEKFLETERLLEMNNFETFKEMKRLLDWDHIIDFKPEEFDQDCGNKHGMFLPDSGKKMQISHIEKEQKIRTECGNRFGDKFKTIITDGIRTPEYNKKIGGSPNSAHLKGLAADRRRQNPTHAYYEVKAAIEFGMTGIGLKIAGPKEGRFIHFDSWEDDKMRPNVWTYEVEKNYTAVPEEAVKCFGAKAFNLLKNAFEKNFTCIIVKQGLGTPLESRWIAATNDAPTIAPVLITV